MTSDPTFPDLPSGHFSASEALALLRARAGAAGEQTVPDEAVPHPGATDRPAADATPVGHLGASQTPGPSPARTDDGSSTSAAGAPVGPTPAPGVHPHTSASSTPEARPAVLARDLAPERWDAVRAATHDGRITASEALRLLDPARP